MMNVIPHSSFSISFTAVPQKPDQRFAERLAGRERVQLDARAAAGVVQRLRVCLESREVSLAIAARPTMAPAATAAIQSDGANSARGAAPVKRNRTAAVRNRVEVLMAASTAPGG